MKMNKKGFTLIEMLVVIAIIAVLVSIIIPVVGSSTTKAEAATDAANLRSVKASLTMAVLDGTIAKPDADDTAITAAQLTKAGVTAPTSETGCGTFAATIDKNGEIEVKFGNATIATLAAVAAGDEGATLPAAPKGE